MIFKKCISAVTSMLISLTSLTCGASVNAESHDVSFSKHRSAAMASIGTEEVIYSSSGDCGRNVNYSVSGTTLTISGEGNMYDYYSELNKEIFNGRDDVTRIIVEDGVTSVPSYAFYNMESVQEVIIGNDVTYIGHDAFTGCNNLKKISIGDSLQSMDSIPLDDVPEITFSDNSCFTTIDGIIYDKNVTKLIYMGKANSGKEILSIPDTVTKINHDALKYGNKFTSIYIGAGITDLSEIPYNLSSLEEINVSPDNLNYSSIDGVLYDKDVTKLIKYPDSKTTGSFVIPDSVTKVNYNALKFGNKLTSIYIGAGITDISEIPYNLSSLEEINVSPDNSNYSSIDGVLYNKDVTELIKYPEGKTTDSFIIPDSVSEISNSFSSESLSSITELHIGENFKNFNYHFEIYEMPLERITVSSGNSSFTAKDNILYTSDMTKIIRVGVRNADKFEVDENISSISSGAFNNCTIGNLIVYNTKCSLYSLGGKINSISGYSGSTAHRYVTNNTIPFTALDADTAPLTVMPESVNFNFEYHYGYSSLTKRIAANRDNVTYELKDNNNDSYCSVSLDENGNVSVKCNDYSYWSSYNYSCEIIVSDGTETITVPVEIIIYPPPTSSAPPTKPTYRVTATDTDVAVGDSIKIEPEIIEVDSYGLSGNPYYSYSCDSPNVSVDSDGNVTALSVGEAEIDIECEIEYSSYYYISSDHISTTMKVYCFPEVTSLEIASFVDDISKIRYKSSNLKDIYVNENNPYYSSDGTALYDYDKTKLLVFPLASDIKEYKIPEGVDIAQANPFKGSENLSKLMIPDNCSVNSDTYLANELEIYNAAGKISTDAFNGHSELSIVTIDEGITLIEDSAFANCVNLKKIVIPESVTGIRYTAFNYDTNLEIWGYTGSYAEKYADMFGFPFFPLDSAQTTTPETPTTTEITSTTTETTTPITTTEITSTTTETTTPITTTETTSTTTETTTTNTTTTNTTTENTSTTMITTTSITTTAPDKIQIQQPYIGNLYVGNTFNLNYTTNNYSGNVIWVSGTPNIVSINTKGEVTVLGEGNALIYAIDDNGISYKIRFNTFTIKTSPATTTTTTTTKKPTVTTAVPTTTIPVTSTTEAAPKVALGDVDNNGSIDALDASIVLTEYALVATGHDSLLNADRKKAADLNKDGTVDALDASLVLSYYAYRATGGNKNLMDYLK